MARYPRITVSGHDTAVATVATLPSNPDHGLVVYIESLKQAVAYDAVAAAWYVLGPIQNAGVPTDGVAGTGVGVIFKGAQCVDNTTGVLFVNRGTAASPVWVIVGTQAS